MPHKFANLTAMALANSAKKPKAERTASRRPTPARPQTPKIDEQYACFGLKLAPSLIHRWGVYATEFIPNRRKVIEYTGERISRRETKRRAESSDLIYLFTLDNYWAIDGSAGGSGAQFINHSCEPNLVARIMKGHIIYISLRDIRPGEELTLDYHFDKKVEKVPCHCGSLKCRGTINVLE
jgi:SET domain-containing protein